MKRKKPEKLFKPDLTDTSKVFSFKWYTEEEMLQHFAATPAILRQWRRLGLPFSHPTGRNFYNQTDVHDFLMWFRNRNSEAA